MSDGTALPATVGLVLALGGPPLIAWVSERRAASGVPALAANLLAQLALVGLMVAVMAIALGWEALPLRSLGLGPITIGTIFWGVALAAFFIGIFGPAAYWLLRRLAVGGFERGLGRLAGLPVWCLAIAVAVGGTAEELLYRGYAIDRLTVLTGSVWAAAAISLVAFGLAHLPFWGWGPALTTLISGAILTAFFLWRHDLVANIIAHVATDAVGLIVGPALARRSRRSR